MFKVTAFHPLTGSFLFCKVVTSEDVAEALATALWHPETNVSTTWEKV